MRRWCGIALLAASAANAIASLPALAANVAIRHPIGEIGDLVFNVPDTWQSAEERGVPFVAPTIVFQTSEANFFRLMVTPLMSGGQIIDPRRFPPVDQATREAVEEFKRQAVEKKIEVKGLSGANVSGAYFAVTDRAPKPDEFKYMTTGFIDVGGFRVSFTAFSNDDSRAIEGQALGVLETLAFDSSGARQRVAPSDKKPDRSNETLRIEEKEGFYLLSVPVSQLTLAVSWS